MIYEYFNLWKKTDSRPYLWHIFRFGLRQVCMRPDIKTMILKDFWTKTSITLSDLCSKIYIFLFDYDHERHLETIYIISFEFLLFVLTKHNLVPEAHHNSDRQKNLAQSCRFCSFHVYPNTPRVTKTFCERDRKSTRLNSSHL